MRRALLQLQILIAGVRHHGRERGASLVEYALLVGLIAVVCFVAVQFLGDETSSGLYDAGSKIRP